MIEPLLMLTVLNCFFMVSTTVTTCALWWRNKGKKCCNNQVEKKNINIKKDNSSKEFKDEKNISKKNSYKLDDRKEIYSMNRRNCNRKNRYDTSSEKSIKLMAQPVFKETHHQQRDVVYAEKLTSTEAIPRQIRPSQPTKRDNKSAVVMEFSTTQKVVQIIDNENNKSNNSSPIESTSYRIEPPERRIEFSVQKKINEI